MQIPVYPVIDADFERDSYKRLGETSGPTRAQMEWLWTSTSIQLTEAIPT